MYIAYVKQLRIFVCAITTSIMNKAEQLTGIDLSQWEVNPIDKDQYYNCDAVIEAYLKGEKEGLKNEQKVLFNQFKENMEKSKEYIVQVLNIAEQYGFKPISAYIKAESFDMFQALIPVPENDFIHPDFLKVYSQSTALENKVRNDIYSINFSFLPISNQPYEENILSDGFFIRLVKNVHA